jgi:plastocyanin
MTRPIAFRLAALAVAVGLAAGACGGSGPSGSPVIAEPNSPMIWADDLKFESSELAVPAGRPFTLVFENRESAAHNVAIFKDASAAVSLFVGDVFGGPATRVYAVPALPAGSYYFRCDVHPQMSGTVIASPEPAPSPSANPVPSPS